MATEKCERLFINLVLVAILSNAALCSEAPSFIVQPTDHTIEEGFTVELECRVSGSPPPWISWEKEGASLSLTVNQTSGRFSVNGEGSLIISGVEAEDSGVFTCFAVNGFGAVESAAIVDVRKAPTFVIAPQDKTVDAGSTTTFDCKVSGSPAPTVFWNSKAQELMFPMQDRGRFSVSKEGSLTIEAVQDGDTGVYTCTAMNAIGSIAVSARLEVLSGPEAPTFVTTPRDKTVDAGSTIRFDCKVSGSPAPTVFWQTNRGRLMFPRQDNGRFSVSEEGSLTIEAVQAGDAGVYTCTAMNAIGSNAASARLEVGSAPTFLIIPRDTIVEVGNPASLECKVTGSPTPMISWEKDGKPLSVGVGDGTIITGEGSLFILTVGAEEDGFYSCVAVNGFGRITSPSTRLKVTGVNGPPYFVTAPVDKTAVVGSNVTLECKVYGDPEPAVSWQKDGQIRPMSPGHDYFGRFFVTKGGSLTIIGVKTEDAGVYECWAMTRVRTISAAARLDVTA